MRGRCLNPYNAKWARYGGRGITICDRWDDFVAFAEDMGPHPGKGWSLDRIETNGNYEKNNCQWSTAETQNRHTSLCKVTRETAQEIRRRFLGGETQRALSREFDVSRGVICRAIVGADARCA